MERNDARPIVVTNKQPAPQETLQIQSIFTKMILIICVTFVLQFATN